MFKSILKFSLYYMVQKIHFKFWFLLSQVNNTKAIAKLKLFNLKFFLLTFLHKSINHLKFIRVKIVILLIIQTALTRYILHLVYFKLFLKMYKILQKLVFIYSCFYFLLFNNWFNIHYPAIPIYNLLIN